MITNFQIFENNNEPQVGDYVYVDIDKVFNNDISNFINNNVGRIVKIPTEYKNYFNVEWENVSNDLILGIGYFVDYNRNGRYVHRNEITYYSKNKEDVETYIASLKYGI